MVRPVIIFAIAAVCLASSSLAQSVQSSTTSQAGSHPSSTVIVTAQDNGKEVDLPQGGTLVVRLEANPSTGYSWTVKGDPSPLKLVKSSYRKNNSNRAAGAPGTQELRLAATSSGIVSLDLEYRRLWEYNAAPARTFRIQVNAR
jgi:inhibitor of cysteine peptidase